MPRSLSYTTELALTIWGIYTQDRTLTAKAREQLRKLAQLALVERDENGRYLLHVNLHVYASALVKRAYEDEHNDQYYSSLKRYHGYVFEILKRLDEIASDDWDQSITPELAHFRQLGAVLMEGTEELLSILGLPHIDYAAHSQYFGHELTISDQSHIDFFNTVLAFVLHIAPFIERRHLAGNDASKWLKMGFVAAELLSKEFEQIL